MMNWSRNFHTFMHDSNFYGQLINIQIETPIYSRSKPPRTNNQQKQTIKNHFFHLPNLFSRPKQLHMKVLGYQVVVLEDNAQIQLELDLKVARLQRWARKQPRKLHVDWHLHLWAHVAVGDLQVLNFCGVSRETLGTAACFDANQLDLDAFKGHFCVLNGDGAGEWLGNVAGERLDGARDEELWNVNFLLR
jgi:hypothetical protein